MRIFLEETAPYEKTISILIRNKLICCKMIQQVCRIFVLRQKVVIYTEECCNNY